MKAQKLILALALGLGGGMWVSLPITVLAAGNVDTATGEASVSSQGARPRALVKGDRVVSGDTITTGANGAVLITTDDSGVLAVRPSSRVTIDTYKVNGNEQDSVVLNLLRGSLRSITGWISKTAPKNYKITTSTATIGIRGTDHEVAIGEGVDNTVDAKDNNKEEGEGTWNQVTEGATTLSTPAGELVQQAGTPSAIGRVKAAGQLPSQAASPSTLFKPQASDARTAELKKDAQSNQQQRLDTRKALVVSSGGATSQGGTQVSTQCAPNAPAGQRLDEFIRAYEQGDIAFLQRHISPAMVGYGALINDVQTSTNAQRQTRIQIKDRQMQCGPDVASISFNWEKTFLDAVSFQPGIVRGSSSVLVSGLAGNQWQVGGMAGSSPFAVAAAGTPPGTNGIVSASAPSVSFANNNSGCTTQPFSLSVLATLPPSTPGPSYFVQQFTTPATACSVIQSTGGGNACQLTIGGLPGGLQTIAGVWAPPNPLQTTCFTSYTSSPPMGVLIGGSVVSLISQNSAVLQSGAPGSSTALSAPLVFRETRAVPLPGGVFAKSLVQTLPGTCSVSNFQLPAANSAPICVATPSSLNVAIQVSDADIDTPSLAVLVTASNGDTENFILPRISAGVYRLNALPITRGGSAVVAGNGRIDIPYLQIGENVLSLTISYVDARTATGSNVTRQTSLTLIP